MSDIHRNNPLLQDWNTPFQTPPFNSIAIEHYKPAIKEAIEESLSKINEITCNPASPTFANTIEALEFASERLNRVTNLLFNLNECDTSEPMQAVVLDVLPDLSRYENAVRMNSQLFDKVRQVFEKRNDIQLTDEQKMLLEDTYKMFVRHGVNLPPDKKQRFADIEEQLSQLTQQFNQNVLADNNDFHLHITNESDLSGLPQNVRDMAAEEARERGLEGWVFTLAYPSFSPFITYADNRALREQMWRAYNSRGNRANANDNNDLIRRIVALRHEKASLLDYDTYCDYILEERMVQSLPNLRSFMHRLMNVTLPFARREVSEVSDFAKQMGAELPLQRWDFSYYSEKLKQQRYDFDQELLRPFFRLERVRQGIFDLYARLYGLSFIPSQDVPVYHPDVKVFEVRDGQRLMGLLYLDMFPRPSKRSGAWMTEFRGQWANQGREVRPLIQVVCNFSKPVGDKPAMLSFSEVETFMHEFGHAIHELLSDVTYESLSGTNVMRDFVELPSQLMENWCYEPDFLNTFARHYQTNEPIPPEYIDRIKKSEKFLAGYLFVRQLNLGLTDIAFHTLTQPMTDSAELLERKTMTELLPHVEGCNTSTAFTHIFSGGYASGYYGYKWAEVLDADAFSCFKNEGIFNSATASRLRQCILSRGGSVHPATLFRSFMGREPDIQPLMNRCGF